MIGLALLLLAQPVQTAAAETRVPPPGAAVVPPAPASASVLTLRYDEVVVIRLAPTLPAPIVRLADGEVARGRTLGAGEIRLRLERFAQGETLLVVENDSDRFIDYQAVMTMPDGGSQPTNVCTLLSNGRQSFEHWPHLVAALTLFDFHPADSTQPVTCR